MEEDLNVESADFFFQALTSDKVISIKSLRNKINKAPQLVKTYITTFCTDTKTFEDFLTNYPDLFYAENGRVTRYDSKIVNVRSRAIKYYEKILQDKYENCNLIYKNLRGHIGQADRDVIDFINNFYPADSFKNFLLPVIERKSVNYFKTALEVYGGGHVYMNFRGYISQAPKYIQKYINTYYPSRTFIAFLQSNSDTFVVYPDDTVSFIVPACVEYFKTVLQHYDGDRNYMNIRSFTDLAPEHISRYINNYYPGESFADFLKVNTDVFILFPDDTVSLIEQESVDYFTTVLKNSDCVLKYMDLQEHVNEAPDYVKEFINDYYSGESFTEFLLFNSVFVIFDDDTVSLVEDECVEYFKNVLESHGDGKYYLKLRRHVENAPGYIKTFIKDYYPGKTFLKFLKNNNDVFEVCRRTVYLLEVVQ